MVEGFFLEVVGGGVNRLNDERLAFIPLRQVHDLVQVGPSCLVGNKNDLTALVHGLGDGEPLLQRRWVSDGGGQSDKRAWGHGDESLPGGAIPELADAVDLVEDDPLDVANPVLLFGEQQKTFKALWRGDKHLTLQDLAVAAHVASRNARGNAKALVHVGRYLLNESL